MLLIRRNTFRLLSTRLLSALALLAIIITVGVACDRTPTEAPASAEPTGPVAAVDRLVEDLRANDVAAYSRHALPPALYQRMSVAWSEGRTIWPLTELPLDDRLPGFITLLAAPEAEKTLLAAYNRQFAGADRELRTAAATLGLFATQYVQGSADYSTAEREHYVQLIAALSEWAKQAPLGDVAQARIAIPQLVAAARLTGLAAPDAFRTTGMDRSLDRLAPFFARFKQALTGYGLDLDQALDSAQVRLLEQTGDQARVSVAYTLAGSAIEAEVRVERHDGHWYLTDLLRHARSQVPAASTGAEPGPPPATLETPTDLTVR
ncbi:hypothetical protein [Lysobacter sp. A289]